MFYTAFSPVSVTSVFIFGCCDDQCLLAVAGWGIGVIGMMTLVVAVVGCRMGVLGVDWAWSGDDGGCVGVWCVSAYEIRGLVCVGCV